MVWTNGYQPEDDIGSLVIDQQRLSEGQKITRAGTLGSATTLISPRRASIGLSTGVSPNLARPPSLSSSGGSPFEDILPTRSRSSWTTAGLSVSGSSGSAERPQNNRSSMQQDSDAATESRFRQSSLGTIDSQETLWRESSDRSCLQPPNLPDRREKHDCPKEVQDAFLQSFDSVDGEVTGESWLRIATWWLLKAQVTIRTLNLVSFKSEFYSRSHDDWGSRVTSDQEYANILKSSWILEELILERQVAGDLRTIRSRKLVMDLYNSLQSDLHGRILGSSHLTAPDRNVLAKQDLALLESFEQPVELKENCPRAMDDFTTAHRWVMMDKDHAGYEQEKIIFRTFVDAQIGQRHERMKSTNVPYMLLLWTKTGESEIFVTLCNQRGTLNLRRRLTVDDIEDTESLSDDAMIIPFEFPTQATEIRFMTPESLKEFLRYPRDFFAAVKGRDPQMGELTVFQTVLKSYRKPTMCSPDQPSAAERTSQNFGSCELRLYESLSDTCWKTTRRLVISSAADSKKLGSVSHWLPLSNVRVQVEDSTVTLSWSDLGHLEKINGGNYNPYFSFVYKPDTPNNKVLLVFHNADEAQKFEESILFLTDTPPQVRLSSQIETPSAFQETRVYDLYDRDDPDKGYHAIVAAKKSPQSYHIAQLCYVYRDLGFRFHNEDCTLVDLYDVRAPHYISTRHKMLSRPREQDVRPQFREVTSSLCPMQLLFTCDHDTVKFVERVTGWRLKFYRVAAKLVTTDTTHRLSRRKETYKGVGIHLFEKASAEGRPQTQLLVQTSECDKPWLSAPLTESAGGISMPMGFVAELQGLRIQQGKDIDTKHMTANTNEEENSQKRWKFALTFKGSDGEYTLGINMHQVGVRAQPLMDTRQERVYETIWPFTFGRHQWIGSGPWHGIRGTECVK
ncbi:MAG: hypothetical protein Q9167_007549 [Letrouitia subvulpina]